MAFTVIQPSDFFCYINNYVLNCWGWLAQWKNTRFVIFYSNRPWFETPVRQDFFKCDKINLQLCMFDFESSKYCQQALATLNPRPQKAVAT